MNIFHHGKAESGMTQPDPNASPDPNADNVPPAADPAQAAPTSDPTAVPTQPDTTARDAEWQAKLDAMQSHLDALTAQLAQQPAPVASTDSQPIGLKSGTYRPNDTVELVVWENGDPAPAGLSVVTTSNGTRLAVKNDDSGQVVRDPDGNAYSVHEGTALAVHGDGHYEYLTNPDDVGYFTRRFKEAG